MSQDSVVTDRLDSWKEIASYVGRDVRTVIRWEQLGGLPVYRVPVGQRQAVYAYRHEIDTWLKRGAPGNNALAELLEVASARAGLPGGAVDTVARSPVPGSDQVRAAPWSGLRATIWVTAAVLTVAAVYAARLLVSPEQIEFTSVAQITSDGTRKEELVTDGRNLFFNEDRHGRLVLASVSADGGAVRFIASPFVKAFPQAVSHDGKSLLVLASIGQESEKTLWILPVSGGEPTRVGHILAHEAAWSPDGRRIAYAYGNALYLTDNQGESVKELQTFTNTPELLEWFPDGTRLRFQLRDLGTRHGSFWELSFSNAEAATLSSLAPMYIDFDACCNASSSIDAEARSFLTGDELDPSSVRTIERAHRLWGSQFTSTRLKPVVSDPGALALDSRSRRLFVIGASTSLSAHSLQNHWNEAYVYDRKSGEVRPFLPGISAEGIDFSRDGIWITYTNTNTQTLWVSRPDGNNARQIDISANDVQLPRWSPDGRQIAFMARQPGRNWRIFVTSVDKGKPKEASVGNDSQGAPTWSPDGKWLVYGNVWCEQSRTCAIRKIDLSSGQVSTLPGSDGFETARWSPDGRYVAALWPDHHWIEVFDVRTEQWRKLLDDVTGNDLSWSADSRSLYASNLNGDRPNVIQVSLADGSVKPAVDLSVFRSMTGRIDTWFGVTPDSSIIFLRWQSPNEIYALNFVEK
jgi:Tol biopolymer transport system component